MTTSTIEQHNSLLNNLNEKSVSSEQYDNFSTLLILMVAPEQSLKKDDSDSSQGELESFDSPIKAMSYIKPSYFREMFPGILQDLIDGILSNVIFTAHCNIYLEELCHINYNKENNQIEVKKITNGNEMINALCDEIISIMSNNSLNISVHQKTV